jgi:hypothetical protein
MRISGALTRRRWTRMMSASPVKPKKVLGEAMAPSVLEREKLAELLMTSPPRLSKREQAEIEKAWVDEGIARAEALRQGDPTAEDGATAIAELRSELRTVPCK